MHETHLQWQFFFFWSGEEDGRKIRGQAGSAMREVKFRITAT